MSKEHYSPETENDSESSLKKTAKKIAKWAAIIGIGAFILSAL